jgi:hypothetical protein
MVGEILLNILTNSSANSIACFNVTIVINNSSGYECGN